MVSAGKSPFHQEDGSMATSETKKNETKSSNKSRTRGGSNGGSSGERGAFFGGNSGAIIGAAVAGAAVGLAANYGRKMLMQSPAFMSGNWDDALRTEHKMTLTLFDQLEATGEDAATTRAGLVMKIKYALSKHALQEENVIYPAMREANEAHDADALTGEHGYVKTFLYELENMDKTSPSFLPKVREFRTLLEAHIRNEEDNVFPRLRAAMSDEQNRKISLLMNKEGLKLA
jgi:hemerythrin superfamily protein